MKTKLSLLAWVVSTMVALAADQPVDLTATDEEAFNTHLGKSVILRGRLEMGVQGFILVGAHTNVQFYVIRDVEPKGSDNHYLARWDSFVHKQVRVTGELKFRTSVKSSTLQSAPDYFYMVLQRTGIVGLDSTVTPNEPVLPALERDETIAGAKARGESIATWQPWTKPVRNYDELVEALRARWPIERIKVFCTSENERSFPILVSGLPVFPEPPNTAGLLYPEGHGEWIPFFCVDFELNKMSLAVRNGTKAWWLENGSVKGILAYPPKFRPVGF